MKTTVLILALVGLAFAAPNPRKVFHENVEDFISLIFEEVGSELGEILTQYNEYEEFQTTVEYLRSTDFTNLIYEMESLPEFKAVIDFLENDNIDILYFIDRFNEGLDSHQRLSRSTPRDISGTDFTSFIQDSINIFPKDKLAALFEEKKAEDEEFKVAVENLLGDEWNQIFDALWANDEFHKEVDSLADNGVSVALFITEIKAIFGQN